MDAPLLVSDPSLGIPPVDGEPLVRISEEVASRDSEEVPEVTLMRLAIHENEDVRVQKIGIDRVELLDCLMDIIAEPVERRVGSCSANYFQGSRGGQLMVKPEVRVDGLDLAEKHEIVTFEHTKIGSPTTAAFLLAE